MTSSRAAEPYILGLAASHNGAACLLHGERIVAAVQEERLTRFKRQRLHAARPSLAIRYCLEAAGIDARQLSMIVVATQGLVIPALEDPRRSPDLGPALDRVPLLTLSHHRAHALAAFATSGFEQAAVMVVDGLGSPARDLPAAERAAVIAGDAAGGADQGGDPDGWEITSLYRAAAAELTPLAKQLVPGGAWLGGDLDGMRQFGSLGGLFAAASWAIFGDHDQAGKVMGLAALGTPSIPVEDFLHFDAGRFIFHPDVPRRSSGIAPWPANQARHADLAASVQRAVEHGVLALGRHLRQLCPLPNLAYSGGVALNVLANERLLRQSGFTDIFIQPAAEDSGTAIGAAYHGLWQLTGRPRHQRLERDAVGRRYPAPAIDRAIAATPAVAVVGVDHSAVNNERDRAGANDRRAAGAEITAEDAAAFIEACAERLAAGQIIGWFQGRSELGPRALGQRSILADPRQADARERLNRRIKRRFDFQPFAPMVLEEAVADWFDLGGTTPESPFMLRSCPFLPGRAERVPAVVHADGTGRLQTVSPIHHPLLHRLISAFAARTGVPMLLNTSFNVAGEPIVETPEQALLCLLTTDLDACALGHRLVVRGSAGNTSARTVAAPSPQPSPGGRGGRKEVDGASLLDLVPRLTVEPTPGRSFVRWYQTSQASTAPPGQRFARVEAATTWGRVPQVVTPELIPLLTAIAAGAATGWQLLDSVGGGQWLDPAPPPAASTVPAPTVPDTRAEALAAWSREAGDAILVGGELAPMEIVTSLHAQRAWSIDSPDGLAHTLAELARRGIIAFHPPRRAPKAARALSSLDRVPKAGPSSA